MLEAATHIMNDDVRAAEAELKKGNSSYHKVRMWRGARGALNFRPGAAPSSPDMSRC